MSWKKLAPHPGGSRAALTTAALGLMVVMAGCASPVSTPQSASTARASPVALWNSTSNKEPAGTLLLNASGSGARTFRLAPSGKARLTVRVSCVSSGAGLTHASISGPSGYLVLGFECQAYPPGASQAIFGAANVSAAKAGSVLNLAVGGPSKWKLAIWAS
jgi:hypothetical protein